MSIENTRKPGEEKKNKSSLIAFIITTLLLLGASGYLFYDNGLINEQKEAQRLRIDSLNTLKSELQKEIASIEQQLKQYEGRNAELQGLIDSLNVELDNRKTKIQKLLVRNASIPSLQREKKELKAEKEVFLKKIQGLDSLLTEITKENEQLKASTLELNQQLGFLQERNLTLEKKIQIASILKTSNVIVIGEKKGKGGKYTPTSLKKAERLLITFDIMENKITEPGDKDIYITVTNPAGKVIEGSQSGTFTNKENNMAIPYTLIQSVNYNNSEQKAFAPVEINKEERKPGNYNIEFYCDGYLCGVKKLAVK